MDVPTTCANCSDTADNGKTLSLCARCKTTVYCGRECQAADWPKHNPFCKADNYILRIHLCPTEITNPPIWRTLSCPATASFVALHNAIQAAFGWVDNHCYDFVVKDPNADHSLPTDLAAVVSSLGRISHDPSQDYGERLNHLRIVPWKPNERQGPKGWMFPDAASNSRRVHSRTPELSARKTKLSKVFENANWKGCPFQYLYDFGDHWDHMIEVVGREAATKHFVCKEGGGHGPAEDVGSDQGWNALIKAYRAATPSEEQRSKMRWYESMCPNGDAAGLRGRENEWDLQNSKLQEGTTRCVIETSAATMGFLCYAALKPYTTWTNPPSSPLHIFSNLFDISKTSLSAESMALLQILILSDACGEYPDPASLPEADVVLYCGNMNNIVYERTYDKFLKWLRAVKAELKLAIAGNLDYPLDSKWWAAHNKLWKSPNESQECLALLRGATADGIHYLDEGTHKFTLKDGRKFSLYASPYTPTFSDTASPAFHEEAFAYPVELDRFNNPRVKSYIPNGVDIVMTHGPPLMLSRQLYLLDVVEKREHCGCVHLANAIKRVRPLLHCFGHTYEGNGILRAIWTWGYLPNPLAILALAKQKVDGAAMRYVISTKRSNGETVLVNAALGGKEDRKNNKPWAITLEI
ncbi:ser thr protein phosphatase family protein [Seiridium cupressi]